MKIGALAPWYGSNRMLAQHVGKALAGCEWVGIPFAGGMCELPAIKARTVLVGDLHCHVLNLACVVADEDWNRALVDRLESRPFHETLLIACQRACIRREEMMEQYPAWKLLNGQERPSSDDYDWAFEYFVSCWASRNATAGTKNEFDAGFSVRWDAGGGDSAVRFYNAARGLRDWQKLLRRCTFVRADVFEFLPKVKDAAGHGLYLDPPFPGPGDKYKYRFTEDQHRRLAVALAGFTTCRVVCRFYDVPLVRTLYSDHEWDWQILNGGRKQSNAPAPEVLLVKGGVA